MFLKITFLGYLKSRLKVLVHENIGLHVIFFQELMNSYIALVWISSESYLQKTEVFFFLFQLQEWQFHEFGFQTFLKTTDLARCPESCLRLWMSMLCMACCPIMFTTRPNRLDIVVMLLCLEDKGFWVRTFFRMPVKIINMSSLQYFLKIV